LSILCWLLYGISIITLQHLSHACLITYEIHVGEGVALSLEPSCTQMARDVCGLKPARRYALQGRSTCEQHQNDQPKARSICDPISFVDSCGRRVSVLWSSASNRLAPGFVSGGGAVVAGLRILASLSNQPGAFLLFSANSRSWMAACQSRTFDLASDAAVSSW
jgi:hypothetical protein